MLIEPEAALYAIFTATGRENVIKFLSTCLRSTDSPVFSPLLLLNTGHFLLVGVRTPETAQRRRTRLLNVGGETLRTFGVTCPIA